MILRIEKKLTCPAQRLLGRTWHLAASLLPLVLALLRRENAHVEYWNEREPISSEMREEVCCLSKWLVGRCTRTTKDAVSGAVVMAEQTY